MMTALTTALLLQLPLAPPAELLSADDEHVLNLHFDPASDLATWDVVVDGQRQVRLMTVSKKRTVRPPKTEGPARAARGDARKPLINTHDGERWSVQIRGKEPASPSAASDLQGTISPNGEWLAFVSGRSGKGDVYVTPAGKTNQPPRRVAESPWPELYPSWSPDSTQLAVVQTVERGRQLMIYKGVTSGGTISEVPVADERINPLAASWRPDGKEVAFYARNWSSPSMLYVATPGVGAPVQRMARVRVQSSGPAWYQQGDKWYVIAIRYDGAIIAIDPLGSVTELNTGTFGNEEVQVGVIKGKTWLIFTALGLQGTDPASAAKRKVYRWQIPTLE